MERISSRQNPLVARFREAARRPGRDAPLLLDGRHLVAAALDGGVSIEVVAVGERARREEDEAGRRLLDRLSHGSVRLVEVSDAVLAALTPVRAPSGWAALAARPHNEPEDLLRPDPALVLVTVGVQDPGNVGAIIRAADAAGATGVIAAEGSADPYGWKALRGAMGSTWRVPVWAGVPLDEALGFLRQHDVQLLGTEPRGERSFQEVDLERPSALLVGSEGQGLPERARASVAASVCIPMRDGVESLNVAITAALLVYEARRQRGGHRSPARGRGAGSRERDHA